MVSPMYEWGMNELPFQNIFPSYAKLPTSVVLLRCGLRSAALSRAALDLRDSIAVWHSTITAYFRLHYPECEDRMKGSHIFPKAPG